MNSDVSDLLIPERTYLDVDTKGTSSTLKIEGLPESSSHLPSTSGGCIYLSSPIKGCDLYTQEPVISGVHFELLPNGMKILTENGIEVIVPFHVMCCLRGPNICYEVKFLAGSSREGCSVTFSAPVSFGLGKIPNYAPDSLFDCEEFLTSLMPGCKEEFHTLLIDLTSELCLVHEYTEDVGECYDYVSDLYKAAVIERATIKPKQPRPFQECAESSKYIADGKWVSTGKDGTVKLTPNFEAVGYLTDLSVEATLTQNNDCVITVRHAMHTGYETVIEFQSPNHMPESLPLATLQAMEYIRINNPESQDKASSLVIGSTGWLLHEEYYGPLDDMYREAAALYEKSTGERPIGIKTSLGYGYDWDES